MKRWKNGSVTTHNYSRISKKSDEALLVQSAGAVRDFSVRLICLEPTDASTTFFLHITRRRTLTLEEAGWLTSGLSWVLRLAPPKLEMGAIFYF